MQRSITYLIKLSGKIAKTINWNYCRFSGDHLLTMSKIDTFGDVNNQFKFFKGIFVFNVHTKKEK